MKTTVTTAGAFGEGTDARLGGYELADCPYTRADGTLYEAWRHGWQYTSRYWGKDARPGQYVRRLPLLDHEFTPETEAA